LFSSKGRHPRSKRDWSSDVCASDLSAVSAATRREELAAALAEVRRRSEALAEAAARRQVRVAEETTALAHLVREAGRLEARVNEGRKSGVEGKRGWGARR